MMKEIKWAFLDSSNTVAKKQGKIRSSLQETSEVPNKHVAIEATALGYFGGSRL